MQTKPPTYAPAPYSERMIVSPSDGTFSFVKTQNVDHVLAAAKDAREQLRKDTGPIQGRYLGTVPVLVAQQWAKECGAAVGTKEWSVYAKKKLADGTWAKLRVHS